MSKTQKLKVPFGIDAASGDIRWIGEFDKASNGLSCNCKCPACNGLLIANIGIKKRSYFSHYHGDAVGCSETALHKLGKLLI